MAKSNQYSGEADAVERYIKDQEVQLQLNKGFTGSVVVNETYVRTTTQILADVQGVYDYQDDLYGLANSTWNNIQSMTSILQQSNGSVQVLLDTVKNAMDVLDEAKQSRLASQSIIDEDFSTGAAELGTTLDTLEATVNAYMPTILTSTQNNNAAEVAANSANRTIYRATVFSNSKHQELASSLALAKMASANATEAQDTTTGARASTVTYKNLGLETKSDMTQAVVDVVDGITRMNSINAQIQDGNAVAAKIDSTVIPPKLAITTIAQDILTTEVSKDRVQQVSSEANAALVDANRAMSITQEAS